LGRVPVWFIFDFPFILHIFKNQFNDNFGVYVAAASILMPCARHLGLMPTKKNFVKGSFHDTATEAIWSQALNLKCKKPDEHTLRIIIWVSFVIVSVLLYKTTYELNIN